MRERAEEQGTGEGGSRWKPCTGQGGPSSTKCPTETGHRVMTEAGADPAAPWWAAGPIRRSVPIHGSVPLPICDLNTATEPQPPTERAPLEVLPGCRV